MEDPSLGHVEHNGLGVRSSLRRRLNVTTDQTSLRKDMLTVPVDQTSLQKDMISSSAVWMASLACLSTS